MKNCQHSTHVEPKASAIAVRLGGVVGLKDLCETIFVDSPRVVFHFDQVATTTSLRNPDIEHSEKLVLAIFQSLDGILNQLLADGADKIPMLSRYCSQPCTSNDTADQGGF